MMDMICPWDRWLKFHCPLAENAFLVRMHSRSSTSDGILYAIGLVYVALKIILCKASGWNYFIHQLGCLIIMGFGAGLLLVAKKRWGPYADSNAQGRLQLLSMIRMIGACIDVIALGVGVDPSKAFSPNQTLLKVITHTPIACAVIEGIAFVFPFKWAVLVHGAISVVTVQWIHRFQAECAVNASLEHAVNEIGHTIEEMLIRLSVMGFPLDRPPAVSGQYPCWLVGGFWHMSLTFMLPTLVVFLTESRWRIDHLKSRALSVNSDSLSMFFLIGLIEKVLIGLIGTQVVWFTLKGVVHGGYWCHMH